MLASVQKFWHSLFSRKINGAPAMPVIPPEPQAPVQAIDLDIAPHDPFLAYVLGARGVIEVEKLSLDSPALRQLKAAGVKVSVPLVSQGELIGLLNLGPRRSEQDYSSDDRRLLASLATQAAPALRVAQLARQQQLEVRQRERMDQELRVARVIQETLLPSQVPDLPGWKMNAHWQPARAVSGDFYDFIPFPDGRLALVVADVTDKGVPAAMVMATTRSILRSAADGSRSPGQVLERVNDLLCPDMPANMFVTCLYALLDPLSGVLRFANAGHPAFFQRTAQGVLELRARGMPLGLMPGMSYEEKETLLAPGDALLMYSDGLSEAHNPAGEMFGLQRVRSLVESLPCCDQIGGILAEYHQFCGSGWEQEDDVTLMMIERTTLPVEEQPLAQFSLPSQPGNERQAMERVGEIVLQAGLPVSQVERLKTAVGEAVMNAMEHGNRYQAGLPVEIEVLHGPGAMKVRITDQGGEKEILPAQAPDLEAKLAGLQPARGWGLFLIQSMVDEMNTITDGQNHTVELTVRMKGIEE